MYRQHFGCNLLLFQSTIKRFRISLFSLTRCNLLLFQGTIKHDGISMIRAYSKWAKKWKEFVKKYPDFYMNGDIQETIQEYEGIVYNYYN